MALGADTWDAAPEIWGGALTSDPTPLPPAEGPDRPYHSAWWKITPDVDCIATIDTSQSASTNPSFSVDTYLIVYTGATSDAATIMASDDDSGGNATSRLTRPLSAGVTYHIRAGSYGPDGGDIATLVLNVSLAVMSEWIQAPDVTRTRMQSIGERTFERVDDRSVTVPSPSAGAYSDVVNGSWNSPGTVATFTGTSDLSTGIGPGIDTRGGAFSGQWTYVAGSDAGAFVRAMSMRMATPDAYFDPFAMAPYLPTDAGDDAADSIELESPTGTRLATSLVYELFEESNDRSADPSIFLDAIGDWTHHMTTPVGPIDVLGPGAYDTQIATGSLNVTGHLDPVDDAVPISLRTIWRGVTVRDPAFGNNVGLVRVGAGHWYLHTESVIRPPRFRYLKPFTTPSAPPPYIPPVRVTPSLRMLQRGGSGGMSGIPRMVGDPTRRGIRQGPGSIY